VTGLAAPPQAHLEILQITPVSGVGPGALEVCPVAG
jgi:hypothetical protein